MTPLFHRIVKELTLPPKRRTFENRSIEDFFSKLSDVHCFELTEVWPIMIDLSLQYCTRSHDEDGRFNGAAVDERTAFLPAPRTWLEWKSNDGNRSGVLLDERNGLVLVTVCTGRDDFFGSTYNLGLPLKDHQTFREIRINKQQPGAPDEHFQVMFILTLYAALAIINTPRIMGRRQHMPHRGLERRLTSLFRPQGKFPLHAWTEIKLEVAAPHWADDEPSTEAHFTGHKALHFCRAHLRIRLGRLEIVRSHWRGDASLGIRQSRYKLIEERQAR